MQAFEKGLFIFIFGALLAACAGGTGINFKDGSWSSCTYSKVDGTIFTAPLQLGGAPLAFTQPSGTKVVCVPIPKEPTPELAV